MLQGHFKPQPHSMHCCGHRIWHSHDSVTLSFCVKYSGNDSVNAFWLLLPQSTYFCAMSDTSTCTAAVTAVEINASKCGRDFTQTMWLTCCGCWHYGGNAGTNVTYSAAKFKLRVSTPVVWTALTKQEVAQDVEWHPEIHMFLHRGWTQTWCPVPAIFRQSSQHRQSQLSSQNN